jgi:hypothetical protein
MKLINICQTDTVTKLSIQHRLLAFDKIFMREQIYLYTALETGNKMNNPVKKINKIKFHMPVI